jgi:hypothetical protein
MSGQWHPDTEALAEYRAGLIGGFRRRRLAAHVGGCAQCASVSERLDAVGSVLASAPAPAMPDEVERRIAAALAAEATARQVVGTAPQAEGQAEGTAGQGAAPSAGRHRHRRRSGASGAPGSGRRPARRFRPVMTLVPVAACLLLAGFGYLLSNIGGSSGPSGAVSAASPSSAASVPAAAPAPTASGLPAEGSGSAGSVPGALEPAAGPSPGSGARAGFVVTASGTSYQRATLGLQVRHQMAVQAASRSAEAQPTEGQRAAAGSAPSPSLAACVRRLTGNEPPSLVDRATYAGKPAYVIAVPARAWVVGLDCTAITSIPLAGPG